MTCRGHAEAGRQRGGGYRPECLPGDERLSCCTTARPWQSVRGRRSAPPGWRHDGSAGPVPGPPIFGRPIPPTARAGIRSRRGRSA